MALLSCLLVLPLVFVVGCGGQTKSDTDPADTDTNGTSHDNLGGLTGLQPTLDSDGLLARVGNVEITMDNYYAQLNDTRMMMITEKAIDIDDPNNVDIKTSIQFEIIENEIDSAIYLNYATENDLLPSMSDIEQTISAEIEEQALAVGSYEILEDKLKDEGGVEELRRILRNDPKFEERVTKEKVINHIKQQVTISEEDARDFFESRLLGLAQIVTLYNPEVHTEEQIDKARRYTEVVRDKIGKEMTFADAAMEFSADYATAIDGGRLPELISRGYLLPVMDEVAYSLSIGEVSDVIDTGSTFVILKLEYETYAWDYYFTENGTLPKPDFEDVKPYVVSRLRMLKEYQHEQLWYDEYRDSLNIEVYMKLNEPSVSDEDSTESEDREESSDTNE